VIDAVMDVRVHDHFRHGTHKTQVKTQNNSARPQSEQAWVPNAKPYIVFRTVIRGLKPEDCQ